MGKNHTSSWFGRILKNLSQFHKECLIQTEKKFKRLIPPHFTACKLYRKQ